MVVDNYGSFGDDNTSESDENDDDDDDGEYHESGAPLVTFPDPEFGVPNIGGTSC